MEENRRRGRALRVGILLSLLLTIGAGVLVRLSRTAKPEPVVKPTPASRILPETTETPGDPSLATPAVPSGPPLPPPPPSAPAVQAPPRPVRSERTAVEGHLYIQDGQPARGAQVDVLIVDPGGGRSSLRMKTDEKGAFTIDCSRPCRAFVAAHLPGFGRSHHALDLSGSVPLDFGLQLHAEAVAAGTVEGSDGFPVAGARLKFYPVLSSDPAWDETFGKELFMVDCEAVSTDAGEFRASSLMPGMDYVVEVLREGRDPVRLPLSTTRRSPQKITLRVP